VIVLKIHSHPATSSRPLRTIDRDLESFDSIYFFRGPFSSWVASCASEKTGRERQ